MSTNEHGTNRKHPLIHQLDVLPAALAPLLDHMNRAGVPYSFTAKTVCSRGTSTTLLMHIDGQHPMNGAPEIKLQSNGQWVWTHPVNHISGASSLATPATPDSVLTDPVSMTRVFHQLREVLRMVAESGVAIAEPLGERVSLVLAEADSLAYALHGGAPATLPQGADHAH